jgi:hypothetical protein
MDTISIILLSMAVIGFATSTTVLGLQRGTLHTRIAKIAEARNANAAQLHETAAEFAKYQLRTNRQLESLRDDINDLEDNLDACTDPIVLRGRLDSLLQKATGRDRDSSTD